jgi:hypothetical protein
MNSYLYTLCDDDGFTVLEIRSAFTNIEYDDYFDKYIRPMLSTMSQTYGKSVYLDNRN